MQVQKRKSNAGLGCPLCGGSLTRLSGFVVCRECGHNAHNVPARSPNDSMTKPWLNEDMVRIGDRRGRQDRELDFGEEE